MSPQATEEVSYRKAVSFDGCKSGANSAPKSFPLRGRCRRRRRKRCRIERQYLSTDEKAERRSPLPSSGLRETPDATLPSRGGILRAVRSVGCNNGTKITSPVIRLAGDAGCHPPLKGRDLRVSLVPASCGTVDHRPPGCLPLGGTAACGQAAQRRRAERLLCTNAFRGKDTNFHFTFPLSLYIIVSSDGVQPPKIPYI